MTLIQGIFTIFLAILLTLPTDSCRNEKVKDKSRSGTPQSEASPVATNPSVDEQRIPEGKWGGPHIRLDVSSAGADFEFDCAHGRLQGPLTLQNGHFAAKGTFVRERGRVRMEGAEQGQTVYFKGEVEGSKMILTFSFAADFSETETFTLTHGAEPKLFKCK